MPEFPLATVGALVVGPSERILLIKTHKWKGSWGVPGGKIDYGESIKEALLREFREETGLELYDISWGPIQESINSNEFYKEAHFILLNFIARSGGENVRLNDEAEEFVWVSVDEALTYGLNTPTRRLVEVYRDSGFGEALI